MTAHNQQRIQLIKTCLQKALQPTLLDICDDSAQHIGHVGAKNGLGHFTVKITAKTLNHLSPVEAHRLIYQALGTLMQTDIHALSIHVIKTK